MVHVSLETYLDVAGKISLLKTSACGCRILLYILNTAVNPVPVKAEYCKDRGSAVLPDMPQKPRGYPSSFAEPDLQFNLLDYNIQFTSII